MIKQKRWCWHAYGFTMVEVLVAVSILVLLAALSIPAVQFARASARSMQCKNNLHQIGVALAAYHSTHGAFPPGRLSNFSKVSEFFEAAGSGKLISPKRSTPETPWTILLLPYLDQEELASAVNYNVGAFGYIDLKPPFKIAGYNANHTIAGHTVRAYVCPEDRTEVYLARPWDTLGNEFFTNDERVPMKSTRGNYGACWGNTNWEQDTDLDGDDKADPGIVYRRGAFGTAAVRDRHVTDGLSQTAFVSELLQGEKRDIRGVVWTPAPGACLYMSRLRPNSVDDLVLKDVSGDILFGWACENDPPELPCKGVSFGNSKISFAGARSAHRGGVHVLFGDGSARWYDDGVDGEVWLSMHTIDGGQAEQTKQ